MSAPLLASLVRQAFVSCTLRGLIRRLGISLLGQGHRALAESVWLQPAAQLHRSPNEQTARAKVALLALLANTTRTGEALVRWGWRQQEDNFCRRCYEPGNTLYHRLFSCTGAAEGTTLGRVLPDWYSTH